MVLGRNFCIPHEVTVNEDGELDVKIPEEITDSFSKKINWNYKHMLGNHTTYGNKTITVNSIGTLTYGFFEFNEPTFMFSCKIRPDDCRDSFGLILKSDKDAARYFVLSLDCGMQRVSLLNLPMDVDRFWRQSCTNVGAPKDPGPDGIRVCEKPFTFKNGDVIDFKIVVDHDMMEIFIGEKVAFTYRSYEKPEYEIGIMVQDGNAEYYDIEIKK